jgi:hypothetical protein
MDIRSLSSVTNVGGTRLTLSGNGTNLATSEGGLYSLSDF